MSSRVGQLLGHYRLLRLLGQGGFSEVYLGEHIHLDTYAAVKILHAQLAEDGIDYFRTEARTLARLKHPNIVQVLDFGVEGLMPYLIMQYAPNGTLRQRHPRGVPVALNVVVSYVQQMASALQYAHNQKVVHRDIKPENMLVGEQNQVLLSDFGIAVVTASARATVSSPTDSSRNSAGTASYMAPEQVQGQPVPASDQYALAIVIYEWLTGELPFKGSYLEILSQQVAASPPSLHEKVPSIPLDVEHIVFTALNKDPKRRFGSIDAFANALKQAAQSTPDAVVADPLTISEVGKMEAVLIGPPGRIILGMTKVTIGCASDNTIVLSDTRSSSHHAEIRPEGEHYVLVDLGSMNGTFVNEQKLSSGMLRLLQSGDKMRFGDTNFAFEVSNAAQWAPYGSDDSTIRAISTPPPPPVNPFAPPFNYNPSSPGNVVPPHAQETIYAPPPSFGAQNPNLPPGYTPLPSPFNAEDQTPTYRASSYVPPDQKPAYTPQQQPLYTPLQQSYTPPSGYAPPAQAVNQQPPQPRPSSFRTIVIAIIAFVIVAGSIVGLLVHNNQVAESNNNATATTQTRNDNATAAALTALRNATGTAVASATANATSKYQPFTQVKIDDPLTSGTDWGGSTSQCTFSSAGVQISQPSADNFYFCLHTGQFGDLAMQATMSIAQGNCGGLAFRVIDRQNYYVVTVCQDGTYNYLRVLNNQLKSVYNTNHATSAIQQGVNKQNVVAATVSGSTVNIYVNGQQIDTVTDASLTSNQQGSVGLIAVNEGSQTVVDYTNALVWTE